jgi:hypothetical protein
MAQNQYPIFEYQDSLSLTEKNLRPNPRNLGMAIFGGTPRESSKTVF